METSVRVGYMYAIDHTLLCFATNALRSHPMLPRWNAQPTGRCFGVSQSCPVLESTRLLRRSRYIDETLQPRIIILHSLLTFTITSRESCYNPNRCHSNVVAEGRRGLKRDDEGCRLGCLDPEDFDGESIHIG